MASGGKRLRSHLAFTDESRIPLFPEINKQNYRIRTSDPKKVPVYQKPKFGLSIMVAGAISSKGKSDLIIVPEKVTIGARKYQQLMLPVYKRFTEDTSIFPRQDHVTFQQDGAPGHTAKTTMSKLERLFPRVWGKGVWPGNSPDLSPIEPVWQILKDSVLVSPRRTTRNELVARVTETWNSLTQEQLTDLIESFVPRMAMCAANGGGHTDY